MAILKCRSSKVGPQMSVLNPQIRSPIVGPQMSVRNPQMSILKCRSAKVRPQVSYNQTPHSRHSFHIHFICADVSFELAATAVEAAEQGLVNV